MAASVLFFLLAAPPAPRQLDSSAWTDLRARTVAGAYHIHTTRSDGHGDREAVAAAAARAGLAFVILTDHGDATRPPDPPAYLHGVLVLDAVEISTEEGHYVAIDMPRAPYPLGGAADAVVEDVRRLGGFGVAAHPDSPKPSLRWTSAAAVDGVEWLNLDSEWRDEPRRRLARAGIAYLLRPGPALALLLDRPATLDTWGRLTAARQVVALAGADAHGGVGRRTEDSGRSLAGSVGIPGYGASFRVFSNRVVLDRPLSGDAAADARAIYAAVRKGSVFTAVDALAAPGLLDFSAESGPRRVGMGSAIADASDAVLVARALMPAGASLTIVHDGAVIARSNGELRQPLTGPDGAYRVEVSLPGAPGDPPIPWLLSNPIYFGVAGPPAAAPAAGGEVASRIPPFPWRIEKDAASSGVIRTGPYEASLEYKLADGPRASQFVALATDLPRRPFKAIDLDLAGDRPLRVSVQLRGQDGARWGRSYYVDPGGTAIRAIVPELRPIGVGASGQISSAEAASLLIVIDLTNAAPGRAGTLRVRSSALLY